MTKHPSKQGIARTVVLTLTTTLGAALPVLVVLPPAHTYAQAPAAAGIEGTWQGTLHVPSGPQLRTVLKIARGDGGKLKATFYSIDQGGQPIGAEKTSFENGELHFSIEVLGLTYTGKMAADGKSITGEANQGGTPLPLLLERTTPATEWTIPEAPKPIPPMDPKADPTFEVSTVKPSRPDARGKGFGIQAGKFRMANLTLGEMIGITYGLQAKQIVGAPDWVWTEKFDIQAQSDTPGMPSHAQLNKEIGKLLAERFQLKFHHEKREMSAFVLSVAKGGSKLKPSASDPQALGGIGLNGIGSMTAGDVFISDLTTILQQLILDRPVVDRTGLTGKYNFTLKWTPDDAQLAQMGMKAPATEPVDAPPNLFTAMGEQLGLKLEAGKVPVEVSVIDKVEKPSEN